MVKRVDARHSSGQSPEDAARRARYQAFDAALAEDSGLGAVQSVALAQHADDQVETMLLALSRGAGVAGLAAMPAHWQRVGHSWYRPWLQVPGHTVRDWLRRSGRTWVEDPSNGDGGSPQPAFAHAFCLHWRPLSPHFATPLAALHPAPPRRMYCCKRSRNKTCC